MTTHKYARIERERRFLVERLPRALDPLAFEWLQDLYIADTFLRLRRVSAPDGSPIRCKLGQKQPDPDAPDDPCRRLMTTLYLQESEARLLEGLPGRRSLKQRWRLAEQGTVFVIDRWQEPEPTRGLILAEVEAESDEALSLIQLPDWALREVTADPGFGGAQLAG